MFLGNPFVFQMQSPRTKYSKFSWGEDPQTPLSSNQLFFQLISTHQIFKIFLEGGPPKPPFQAIKFFSNYALDAISTHQIFKIFLGEDPQTQLTSNQLFFQLCFRCNLHAPIIQNFLGGGPPNPLSNNQFFFQLCFTWQSQRTKYSKFSWGRTPKPPFQVINFSSIRCNLSYLTPYCTTYFELFWSFHHRHRHFLNFQHCQRQKVATVRQNDRSVDGKIDISTFDRCILWNHRHSTFDRYMLRNDRQRRQATPHLRASNISRTIFDWGI